MTFRFIVNSIDIHSHLYPFRAWKKSGDFFFLFRRIVGQSGRLIEKFVPVIFMKVSTRNTKTHIVPQGMTGQKFCSIFLVYFLNAFSFPIFLLFLPSLTTTPRKSQKGWGIGWRELRTQTDMSEVHCGFKLDKSPWERGLRDTKKIQLRKTITEASVCTQSSWRGRIEHHWVTKSFTNLFILFREQSSIEEEEARSMLENCQRLAKRFVLQWTDDCVTYRPVLDTVSKWVYVCIQTNTVMYVYVYLLYVSVPVRVS